MKTPRKIVAQIVEIESMSSLEIAELTGKEHKNVLRDIDFVISELKLDTITLNNKQNQQLAAGQLKFEPTNGKRLILKGMFINHQKKRLPIYHLPKRETMIIVSGYSIEFRTKIIDRLDELEAEYQTRLVEEQSRQFEREATMIAYRPLTDGVQTHYGDDVENWHYIREAGMINKVSIGMTAKQFCKDRGCKTLRDGMTKGEIKHLKVIQAYNTTLLDIDSLDFNARTLLLNKKFGAHNEHE